MQTYHYHWAYKPHNHITITMAHPHPDTDDSEVVQTSKRSNKCIKALESAAGGRFIVQGQLELGSWVRKLEAELWRLGWALGMRCEGDGRWAPSFRLRTERYFILTSVHKLVTHARTQCGYSSYRTLRTHFDDDVLSSQLEYTKARKGCRRTFRFSTFRQP